MYHILNYQNIASLTSVYIIFIFFQEELDIAAEQSVLVNKAYKKLKHKVERAAYLLKMYGYDVSLEEQKETDSELLMLVMEINEKLAEVETAKQLHVLDNEMNSRMVKLVNEITEAFSSKDYALAITLYHKLKYFNNIQQKINDREIEFMDK